MAESSSSPVPRRPRNGPLLSPPGDSSPSPAALLRLNAIVGRLVYVAGFEIMTKWGVYAPECIRSGRHLLFRPQKKPSLRMNCRNNMSPPQNRLSPRTRLVNRRVLPSRKVLRKGSATDRNKVPLYCSQRLQLSLKPLRFQ